MSEPMTQDQLTVSYNPNLLVTYKAIPETYAAPESPTFMTDKVTQIEWALHSARSQEQALRGLQGTVSQLEDSIVEWYDPNYSKQEVLVALCEMFNINPVKEIEVQGTISFSGTISVPMSEIADFDMSSVSIEAEVSSYEYDADLTVDEVSVEESY
jgi:hypothetical protein